MFTVSRYTETWNMKHAQGALMQLILWRHAQAEDAPSAASNSWTGSGDPRNRDLARELTIKGEKQARRTAEWLRPRLPPGTLVLVSPAIRTVQTAQQLTANLERVEALAPDTAPEALLAAAQWPGTLERSVVIVGHQPTLGRLASLLLTGQDLDLAFGKSAAWWFQSGYGRGERSTGVLRAVFDPSLG
jgi:phosphohistidine phosphatase